MRTASREQGREDWRRPSPLIGMRQVPGGRFKMGSDHHYPEERPSHRVRVNPFWMDETAVTNAQFAAFVAATVYVTVAERPLDPVLYPDVPPANVVPANLNPHTPVESGERYVAAMGGAANVLRAGREAFQQGDYRWVAELVNHLVFAEPDNREARDLLADAYEQLGYQAESGPWRNFYLTGAQELRQGVQRLPAPNTASPDTVRAMPMDLLLDFLGVRLNPEKAAGKTLSINLELSDPSQKFLLGVENSSLHWSLGNRVAAALPGERFAALPEFFVLMVQTRLRGRMRPERDRFAATSDPIAPDLIHEAEEHGAILITSEPVVRALAEGRMSFESASQRGLAVLGGAAHPTLAVRAALTQGLR